MKQSESLDNAEMSPEAQKRLQLQIAADKSDLEWLPAEEQARQAAELEAEVHCVQDRLDRLEKELDHPP